jgi:hypothetical protein
MATELKINRTLSIPLRFYEYIDKNDIGRMKDGNINYTAAFNTLLQQGLARMEEIKAGLALGAERFQPKTVTGDMEVKNV